MGVGGSKNIRFWNVLKFMLLSLKQTGSYIHGRLYVNVIVTTKQKLIASTQKIMKKESKHNTKKSQ